MRFYNAISGTVEPFEVKGAPVKMYVCGVTPYDTTHLGHAATYLYFDLVLRLIEFHGTPVRYIQNVTDVDDPLFERARTLGLSWESIARSQVDQFVADLNSMNVRQPDHRPFVSDEIASMVEMIRGLESKGYTYAIGDRLYFRTALVPDYGSLGQVSLDYKLLRSQEVGNPPDLPGKESPFDFLLWQPSAEDEPAYPSPWGPGRPGWHIECSAMSLTYLGEQIDIHGGGYDLCFPHHASEIAQTEAFTGEKPFSRFWMHVGLVRLNGEKMSKSLGNLIFARDLLRDYDGDTVRLYIMQHHYRMGWDHDQDLLDRSATLAAQLADIAQGPDHVDETADRLAQQVIDSLDDDLDTPAAVRALESLATYGTGAASAVRRIGGAIGLRLGYSAAVSPA